MLQSGNSLILSSEEELSLLEDKDGLEIFELLLHSGARVDLQDFLGRTLIMRTIEKPTPNWLTNINFLIDHGADLNLQDQDGNTAFHYAMTHTQFEMARLLIEKDAISKVNRFNLTPFQCVSAIAIELGDLDRVALENLHRIANEKQSERPVLK
jgi:ankyrin repeat protein